MAVYLCRWPNGEFSIVSARTKDDAIELLDEWGNAEQASLTRMTDCMFDFPPQRRRPDRTGRDR
jgi:hypothetical protein